MRKLYSYIFFVFVYSNSILAQDFYSDYNAYYASLSNIDAYSMNISYSLYQNGSENPIIKDSALLIVQNSQVYYKDKYVTYIKNNNVSISVNNSIKRIIVDNNTKAMYKQNQIYSIDSLKTFIYNIQYIGDSLGYKEYKVDFKDFMYSTIFFRFQNSTHYLLYTSATFSQKILNSTEFSIQEVSYSYNSVNQNIFDVTSIIDISKRKPILTTAYSNYNLIIQNTK